ncbi:conserved unknown protein [Ectocarpus siliculosus]|uniref:Methionine aminopeptidase n=1 Tax=Ectocarpus siliculosus TaxID=2880 RepID=D8LQW4_ECTSI|nr:conserved unknown protein [Ectocarpus siliculosus]|eukprot:CBN77637.1 conserved unknown protein [Ectocarpus siliculosus]
MSALVGTVCTTPECGKPGTMACPTCIKLGLPASRYCAQACFKGDWGRHKAIHKLAKAKATASSGATTPAVRREFNGYTFSGDLRPAALSATRVVPPHIRRPDYADHPEGRSMCEEGSKRGGGSNAIPVYTASQIRGIREACRIGREVLDAAGRAVRVGATTDEIDRVTHEATVERNAYPSPLNYYNFPKSVCTSVNESICHGIPDMRELKDGDIVNVDVTAYFGGFHGDLNETFMVGKVDEESAGLVETAYRCLSAAVDMVQPGAMYRDLGARIGKIARENGCQVVKTYCGHGIGELFHTVPTVPHYPKNKAKGVMKPGHIFTIEPMINVGTWQDRTWPDNWTSVTADGQRSAQFEHTLLVTDQGCDILTARDGKTWMEWDVAAVQR